MTEDNVRLSRNEYFMDIAILTGKRGTCDRAFVGAIVVKDKRIIMSGYNGSPSGISHCGEEHQMINNHCVKTVHAEANIIANAAKFGISLIGSSLYVTLQPCFDCMKLLISAGIFEVIYLEKKEDERTPAEYYKLIHIKQYWRNKDGN